MTEQYLHHTAEHMTEKEESNLEQKFESPSDSDLSVAQPGNLKFKIPEEFLYGAAANPWQRGTRETADDVAKTLRKLAALAIENREVGPVTRSLDEDGNKATYDAQGRCISVLSPEGRRTIFRYQDDNKEPGLVVTVDTNTGDEAVWLKIGGIAGNEWVGVSNRGKRMHDTNPPYDRVPSSRVSTSERSIFKDPDGRPPENPRRTLSVEEIKQALLTKPALNQERETRIADAPAPSDIELKIRELAKERREQSRIADSPKESREHPTINSAILQLRDGLDKNPADFVNSLNPAQARVLWEHLQKTLPGLRYATDPVADLKSGFRRMQLDSSNDPTRMLSQQEATAFMRLLKGRFAR